MAVILNKKRSIRYYYEGKDLFAKTKSGRVKIYTYEPDRILSFPSRVPLFRFLEGDILHYPSNRKLFRYDKVSASSWRLEDYPNNRPLFDIKILGKSGRVCTYPSNVLVLYIEGDIPVEMVIQVLRRDKYVKK